MTTLRFTWGDVNDGPLGSTPLGQLIQGLRSGLCFLYEEYPQWTGLDPLGIGVVSQTVLDAVCDRSPINPPPFPPPIPQFPLGGRCSCVDYQLVISRRSEGVQQSNIVTTVKGPVTVRGWVSSAVAGKFDFRIDHLSNDCSQFTYQNVFAGIRREDIDPSNTWVEVLSINRLDGNPDDCGVQPPIYPPAVPPIPALNFEVPVNVGGVNVNVPVVFVKPKLDFSVVPTLNLNPSFNVDLAPDINVNISLGIGGPKVSIQPRPLPPGAPIPPTPAPDPRPGPPPSAPPGVEVDDQDCCEDVLDRLRLLDARVRELLACACPDEDLSTFTSFLGEGNSGTFALPEGSLFVKLQITRLPPRARSWNGLLAPSPVTAGWAWFSLELPDWMSSREPVDALRKTFPVPEYATGFSFTLYSGGHATVSVVRKSE